MAATQGTSVHEGRTLSRKHFWNCLFLCVLLLIATSSTIVSCRRVRGTPMPKQMLYSTSGSDSDQLSDTRADSRAPLLYVYSDSSSSDTDEGNARPGFSNEDNTLSDKLKDQLNLAQYQKDPEVLDTILAVGRRANPNLDNSKETVTNTRAFEKIRSGSWEAPPFSIVTDEDIANNLVVEKVLKPSDTFSLELPRKFLTSPVILQRAAHPVVMGECDTTKTVPYTELFEGASPSHAYWTIYPGPGTSSKLVFAAPPEAMLKSGKNAQFCFTAFNPKENGVVTFWVQVGSNGLLTACENGNCQSPQGGEDAASEDSDAAQTGEQ